jgi:hypothetical protein
MSQMFGHHPWTVQGLVNDIHTGRVRLPDIQRPFVWTNAKVRDLIESMYRGYPVGELMFWANKAGDHTKAIGGDTKSQDVSMQVVDGQQRLTSLYAVVRGLKVWREDYSRERIQIAFNPLTERFEVPTPIIVRSPEWIRDIVEVFQDAITARSNFLDRLEEEGKHPLDKEQAKAIELAINRLHLLQNYQFQVVQIEEDVTRETVADIFVRINSEGVSLSAADFILTWLSVFWEEGRSQLEEFAKRSRFAPEALSQITGEKVTWTPHNPYMTLDAGQILRVVIAVGLRRGRLSDAYNALRGRDPRTRLLDPAARQKELSRLKEGQAHALKAIHWDEYLKVLERAGFRSKDMIRAKTPVLYTFALWLIGRIEYEVPVDELREAMARWFFMAQITGRYTGSAESRIQEDLSRLDSLQPKRAPDFLSTLNQQIEAAVPPDWWAVTLPENLETSSANSPAYIGYIAALNVLDADVLLATSKVKEWINPNRRPIKGIEKHHLFPKDYLKSVMGLKVTRKINQVANFALVEWSDNITISNKPPTTYWPQEVADKKIDENRRKKQEQWHALPDGWIQMGYDEFLIARRRLMARVTHDGFKRLTDPNYEPAPTPPQIEPTAAQTELPTLEALVASGALPAGTLLSPVDEDRTTVAEITEDGYIQIGDHLCENPDRAAHEDGADMDSGWDYWLAHLEDTEPVLLADLRQRSATVSVG